MKKILTISATMFAFASASFADGDVDAGSKAFKKCKACHSITAPDGTIIRKGGKAGPNLYGVLGRAAGSEDAKYSKIMLAAGAAGLVWNEYNLQEYLEDPNDFLSWAAGEPGRSKMPKQKVKNVNDIVAYLESVVPDDDSDGESDDDDAESGDDDQESDNG